MHRRIKGDAMTDEQRCGTCRWHILHKDIGTTESDSYVLGKCAALSMGPLPFWMGNTPRKMVREDLTHADEEGQNCEAWAGGIPVA